MLVVGFQYEFNIDHRIAGRCAARLEDWEAAARFFQDRASSGKPGDALKFFENEAGDEPPRPGDEIT